VGLTTSLFVLSLTNALNAEGFTSHKGRFWNAKPVVCGDTLEYGHFELTGNLDCEGEDPAIEITGPAKLNLKGYTLSGNEPDEKFKNVCIKITGDGAKVWNGTVKNCEDGIEIKSDRNRIRGVTSSDNAKRGFRVRGDKNLLFNCTATNNGRKGFSVEEAEDNLLFMCLATNNGHQGFIIEIGDGNKIYYSKAYANCRDGIEIDGGNDSLVFYNHVEDNGSPDTCADFEEDYKPWFYAGINVLSGSKNNKIKHNRAECNLGCVGSDVFPCTAHERDFWDENLDDSGNCGSINEWENNSIACKNAVPECSPNPDD
jgi:parallel beta-helix repeat protein